VDVDGAICERRCCIGGWGLERVTGMATDEDIAYTAWEQALGAVRFQASLSTCTMSLEM
jgi:hypothetical protein